MAYSSLTNKEKAELREIIDQMTAVTVDSTEKTETAAASGCPRGQFVSVVNLKTDNETLDMKPLLSGLKAKVEEKLGEGAFDEEEIVSLLDSLVRNNHEMQHFRKLIRGFNVNPFVVNKIVEIRARSPLDSGQALFEELFQIENVNVSDADLQVEENASKDNTLAKVASRSKGRSVFDPELRKLLLDIALGVGLGVSAIALLV